MKTGRIQILFLSAAILLIAGSCLNDNSRSDKSPGNYSASDTAKIVFRETEHDLGRITEGEKVGCTFVFENKGSAPLVLASVTTSCGCTVPKYDKRPIFPGSSGTIEVIFDTSGRSGRQTKTVTVTSNASKPVVILRIAGDVITSNNNK